MSDDVFFQTCHELIEKSLHNLASVIAVLFGVVRHVETSSPSLIGVEVNYQALNICFLPLDELQHVVDACLVQLIEVSLIILNFLPQVVGEDGQLN